MAFNWIKRIVAATAVAVLAAGATVATVTPAHAAPKSPAGTLQVLWEVTGTWPGKYESAGQQSGSIQFNTHCTGVFTDGGTRFSTSLDCLDPESNRVVNGLDQAFTQKLLNDGYNSVGVNLTKDQAKFDKPHIAVEGEAFSVWAGNSPELSVPGGVELLFPRPGSKADMREARKAGLAFYEVKGDTSKLPSAAVSFDGLEAGDIGSVLYMDDRESDVNTNAPLVRREKTARVESELTVKASNGLTYWWPRITKPTPSYSGFGAPFIVDGVVKGILVSNPDDYGPPYLLELKDVERLLKQHGVGGFWSGDDPTAESSATPSTSQSASPSASATPSDSYSPSASTAPTKATPSDTTVPTYSEDGDIFAGIGTLVAVGVATIALLLVAAIIGAVLVVRAVRRRRQGNMPNDPQV